jgi:hypothetical protein
MKTLCKATITLRRDHLTRLDRVAVDIRASTGHVASRSELIRGFVDAVLESRLDLTRCDSEKSVKDTVLRALMHDREPP